MWRTGLLIKVRDLALIALPIVGFTRELFRATPSVEIMLGCIAALSAPGLLAAGWIARHSPTGGQSSSQASDSPLPPPS